jgi:hypothetical protein
LRSRLQHRHGEGAADSLKYPASGRVHRMIALFRSGRGSLQVKDGPPAMF